MFGCSTVEAVEVFVVSKPVAELAVELVVGVLVVESVVELEEIAAVVVVLKLAVAAAVEHKAPLAVKMWLEFGQTVVSEHTLKGVTSASVAGIVPASAVVLVTVVVPVTVLLTAVGLAQIPFNTEVDLAMFAGEAVPVAAAL